MTATARLRLCCEDTCAEIGMTASGATLANVEWLKLGG